MEYWNDGMMGNGERSAGVMEYWRDGFSVTRIGYRIN
jgi:hypothetical protein